MKPARGPAALASVVVLALAGMARAEAPLSAIDWLEAPAPISVAQPWQTPLPDGGQTGETAPGGDVSGATVPSIDVMPLDAPRADAVGLLPSTTTGLPTGLWAASRSDDLVAAFERMSDTPLPAIQALYYTLLLAEADPPSDAGEDTRFLRARLDALRRFGAVEPALALVERAGPRVPGLFDTWMDLALLAGQEQAPCAALARQPDLTGQYATRVFCLARAGADGRGDWATAALVLDTAAATGALSEHEEQLLAFFLNPELIEEAEPLAPPRTMTPLLFRLYEAVGAPLPTRSLPREYAVADLRGTMGWRAEIEAAERLARTGALPANRLLGLYTERRPAASGGVWDRVRAVQAFDTALEAGAEDEIARTLPPAWRAMKVQGLGVVFATLYGAPLGRLVLPQDTGEAQDIAFEIALLAPDEGTPLLAALTTRPGPGTRFWAGVARGTPDAGLAQSPGARRVAEGFAASDLPEAERMKLEAGQLGEAILWAARRLDTTSASRPVSEAIATLRRVGLEDVARRAAVQLHVLRGL